MATVMRYVASTKNGKGPMVALAQDLPKMVVTREAAFPVEYGVTGKELMRKLQWAAEKFIEAMELQGLTLIPLPQGNPQVVTDDDGRPAPTYSMTHDLDRGESEQPNEAADVKTGGHGPRTWKQPRSLEESKGMVDYRLVGVFWAPQVSIEIAKTREQIRAEERQSRNPRTWRPGDTTPDKPSIAIARS